jgi:hypothetical protein
MSFFYVFGYSVGSVQCRCDQELISCTPDDKYAVVLQCDNSNSAVVTKCSYQKSVGTTFTEENSEMMSISDEIYNEISVRNTLNPCVVHLCRSS